MSFLAAIPAIASLASGLFGKKKTGGNTVPAQIALPGNQQAVGNELADYINKYLTQYKPGTDYSGDFTAPLTGFENTGLNRLQQFLGAPELGALFGAGKQHVLDTVGGKFADPATSPYIQSIINLSKGNLQDSIDNIRAQRGGRGTYFTQQGIEEEGRMAGQAQNYLDTVIGNFVNQERGRQLQAVPLAGAMDQYENFDAPLKKIGASQELGALPRLIEQSDLESQYADFQRQQQELGGLPGQAQSFYSNNTPFVPSYTNPVVQQNNTLGNILNMISKLNLGALSGSGNIWDKLGAVLKG